MADGDAASRAGVGADLSGEASEREVLVTRRHSDDLSWYRSTNTLTEPLRRIVEQAGVRPISLHGFRRTYENLLRQAGVEGLVRRSLAGWRTEHAQEIYAGIDREERTAALQRVVDLVSEKREEGEKTGAAKKVHPEGTPGTYALVRSSCIAR